MIDVRVELSELWRLASRTSSTRGGRGILFLSARSKDGTSSVAASFALIAASRSERNAWLIDLDIRANPQYAAFSKGFVKEAGRTGPPLDASLGTEQIYSVPGFESAAEFGRLLNAHQIANTRLLVTRFRNDRLRSGQKVQLRTAPNWWKAARGVADWLIVDAPALDRSSAGLAFVSQMDGVVLVVKADSTEAADLGALRREVEGHGGQVIGIVLNRVGTDARLVNRLSGSAS